MMMKYIGFKTFRLIQKNIEWELKDGDLINLDPWKIRSSRLRSLFEVAETDPDKLTKAEKKFLARARDFGDPALHEKKVKTPEEWAEELEKEKNKT